MVQKREDFWLLLCFVINSKCFNHFLYRIALIQRCVWENTGFLGVLEECFISLEFGEEAFHQAWLYPPFDTLLAVPVGIDWSQMDIYSNQVGIFHCWICVTVSLIWQNVSNVVGEPIHDDFNTVVYQTWDINFVQYKKHQRAISIGMFWTMV